MSSLPPLPLLLYGEMAWLPSPQKLHVYLYEKKLSHNIVKPVPHLDPEASKAFPKIIGKATSPVFGPTVPKLAIAKAQLDTLSTNQEDYIWLVESAAIMEYLEDLCDAHPHLSPTPSLRGLDLLSRARVRAQLMRTEGLWIALGTTLVLGSTVYNQMTGGDNVHVPSAKAVADTSKAVILDKLEESLDETVDLEGLAANKVGAASVADITLFCSLNWYRICHGIEVFKNYPSLERFMAAWLKRKQSMIDLPGTELPDMVIPFRTGIAEEIWPRAALE